MQISIVGQIECMYIWWIHFFLFQEKYVPSKSFSSMEITNQMAPATAVKNIEHLLVITSDYGISNHNTFLVACAAQHLIYIWQSMALNDLLHCYQMVIVLHLTLIHWCIYYQSKYGSSYHLPTLPVQSSDWINKIKTYIMSIENWNTKHNHGHTSWNLRQVAHQASSCS